VTGGIFEIEAASVVVDPVLLLVPGVSPIGKPTFCDPSEDGVEFFLGDKEGVVVMFWDPPVVVVEADAIGGLETHERPERLRGIETEDLSKKLGGRVLVLNRDDGVIELNCHEASLRLEDQYPIIGLVRL
jgi:hypothetical protein